MAWTISMYPFCGSMRMETVKMVDAPELVSVELDGRVVALEHGELELAQPRHLGHVLHRTHEPLPQALALQVRRELDLIDVHDAPWRVLWKTRTSHREGHK
jgi:uncharacterized lipoprotein YbaY